MEIFQGNRSFAGFDMTHMAIHCPEKYARYVYYDLCWRAKAYAKDSVIARIISYYEQGLIKPISPVHVFEASEVREAFRYMQRAQHIGKVIVTMPPNPQALPVEPKKQTLLLRPDRTYFFVGGLGGLGRSITTWLAEKGAKHITIFSRSAGKIKQDDPFIKELAALGCSATTISGSVTDYDAVVSAMKCSELPIGGVLQASMVLEVDGSFLSPAAFSY